MRSDARKRVVYEVAGFTLTEVLVTMMIMLVVLFALYSIFDMGIRVFSFGNDKVEATEQARLGMEKMEREIRAAYPVDRINGQQHDFFNSGTPLVAALPPPPVEVPPIPANQRRSITFGNDLLSGVDPPNRKIDPAEEITYELWLRNPDGSLGGPDSCPTTGTEGVCVVVRRQGSGGNFEPLVESVVPKGLTFKYLRNDLTAATRASGTDIGVVRITLEVNVDGVEQTLTTDVDLRTEGARLYEAIHR